MQNLRCAPMFSRLRLMCLSVDSQFWLRISRPLLVIQWISEFEGVLWAALCHCHWWTYPGPEQWPLPVQLFNFNYWCVRCTKKEDFMVHWGGCRSRLSSSSGTNVTEYRVWLHETISQTRENPRWLTQYWSQNTEFWMLTLVWSVSPPYWASCQPVS